MTDLFDDTKINQAIKFIAEASTRHDDKRIPLRIALLRNTTLDNLVTFINYYAHKESFSPSIEIGEYDNYMQEAIDVCSPLYTATPDAIIISLYPEAFSDKLWNSFCSLNENQIQDEASRFLNTIERLVSLIRRQSDAAILVHNWPVPTAPSFGIFDYQSATKQIYTVRMVNQQLRDMASALPGVYVIDVDLVQSRLGSHRFHDRRFWHYARSPYSMEAVRVLAKEHIKYFCALKGKNRKCLILDCDNTLWGGIVGEDGVNGLQLGESYPGSCYQDMQKAIIDLHQRGILLALCSKNNEADVLEVFKNHPGMLIKEEHIVSQMINWNDKATNIQQIALDLNIGLDSLVFVDDNPFEIELVQKMLPMVHTIKLPKDSPEIYADLIRNCGCFDTLTFSDEDRRRSDMYKAEASRKRAASTFTANSLDEYYRYLEMHAKIHRATPMAIPRLAQLTQRTNQFNLTTQRYSEAEILALCTGESSRVYSLHLTDRFGELGIVGEVILKKEAGICQIDTFLLSCRVIGRGVENLLLKFCEDVANDWKCTELYGRYLPTRKNEQVKDFYLKNGFCLVKKVNNELHFCLSLEKKLPKPEFFLKIEATM